MDKLFLQIINMSITSSYVIIFVMVFRLFLKRFPKIFSYVLWSVVLFRLIIPFSVEGIFSLVPVSTVVPQNIAYVQKPEINSGISVVDNAVNNILPPAAPTASANPMQIWIAVGKAVWLTGISLLLIYSFLTTLRLYNDLKNGKHIKDNIYEMDKLKTPFVFGIFRPRIYLPSCISEYEKPYILLHEQIHIKRFDHVIKPIAFLVSCIHWFNPLVWAAFFLMSGDMELSCDERVLKLMGNNIKKEYSSSLLSLSTGRRIKGVCPLSFGENNTKGRIKNVLDYKKPASWILVAASVVITVLIIGLITNPKSNEATTWDLRPMIMVNDCLYLDTGKQVPAEIHESAIIGEIDSTVDGSEKPTEEGQTNFGLIGAKYAYFEDNVVVLINNEWFLFEKEIKSDIEVDNKKPTNQDKISAYLKEECTKVFSPYYELLDFIITDYKEEIADGNVIAIFSYKVIDKNYDRDPDTVEYIKEAKERGDKNYQQLYDEYLQPKEMNFFFKAIVDENDNITLYTRNPAIEEEWKEVEISDFIIK